MSDLAGHWHGTVWETGATLVQGAAPLDMQLHDDGTWRGTVGKASASGTARIRRGRLQLFGTARMPDGRHAPIDYSLGGDSAQQWGESVVTFSGREARGQVALEKS